MVHRCRGVRSPNFSIGWRCSSVNGPELASLTSMSIESCGSVEYFDHTPANKPGLHHLCQNRIATPFYAKDTLRIEKSSSSTSLPPILRTWE